MQERAVTLARTCRHTSHTRAHTHRMLTRSRALDSRTHVHTCTRTHIRSPSQRTTHVRTAGRGAWLSAPSPRPPWPPQPWPSLCLPAHPVSSEPGLPPSPLEAGRGRLPSRRGPRAPDAALSRTGVPRGRSRGVRPLSSGPLEPCAGRPGGGPAATSEQAAGMVASGSGQLGQNAENSARHEAPRTEAQACPARENSSANYSRLIVLRKMSKYSLC